MQRKGFQIRIWQWGLLAAIFVFWWAMTKPGFIPAFFFSDDSQAAFFFGEPVIILQRIWEWFAGGEIYSHLGVTLYEPENRGIYTQSDSPKKSSRNIWSLAVVSVDQRY